MGLALMWIMFAYSGWNASTYVGSEVIQPVRNIPRSLITGTLIVTLMYLLLNVLYVYAEATSGDLDTFIVLGDPAYNQLFTQDDDGGGGFNSAFEYTIPATGNYALVITRYNLDEGTSAGTFRALVGLNTPDVLTGTAAPTGDIIATQSATFRVIGPT